MLGVVKERTEKACNSLFELALSGYSTSQVTDVAMDVEGLCQCCGEKLPEVVIVHDWFHIRQHLNKVADKVRRGENRQLSKNKDNRLKGGRYFRLTMRKIIAKRKMSGS